MFTLTPCRVSVLVLLPYSSGYNNSSRGSHDTSLTVTLPVTDDALTAVIRQGYSSLPHYPATAPVAVSLRRSWVHKRKGKWRRRALIDSSSTATLSLAQP